jgi:2-phospho-L-lactate guanylyltransferase
LLPVKSLRAAKLRLAGVLSAHERRGLALAMLHDVVVAVETADLTPSVLSPDPEALAFAAELGATPVLQPRSIRSLNGSLEWALQQRSAGRVLVILPDTPLVTPGEIEELLQAGTDDIAPAIDLVPDRRGRGTNAMLARPPSAIPLGFGRGSLRRHVGFAAARNVEARIHPLAGLGLDIDRPQDLLDFLEHDVDTRTRRLVDGWDVAGRVERLHASASPV